MKKIIRLTESELTRVIKRIINEQSLGDLGKLPKTPEDVKKGFETGYYTVKSGDQLLVIANKFGLTLDEIEHLNGMTNSNIQPGQKLKVKFKK